MKVRIMQQLTVLPHNNCLLLVPRGMVILGCVKLLLAAGADVNKVQDNSMSALICASIGGQPQCVKLLLTAGADVNITRSNQSTVLHEALRGKHEQKTACECVELLLIAGAPLNEVYRDGKTPLCEASRYGCERCISNLVQAGANVNGVHEDGIPLIASTESSSLNGIRSLLQHGADVNRQESKTGNTALIAAAYYCYVKCITPLVEAGADVNAVNSQGCTALITAAESTWIPESNMFNTVRHLLKIGARVNVYKSSNQNALQSHIANGDYWMSRQAMMLLLAAGETVEGVTVEGGEWAEDGWEVKDVSIPDFLLNLIRPSLDLKDSCRQKNQAAPYMAESTAQFV